MSRLTAEEEAQLLAGLRAGMGLAAIGRQLGRPRSNLEGTRRRFVHAGFVPKRERAPCKPWTIADKSKLAAMIDTGYSYDRIASRLGRTRGAVITECKRHYLRITTSDTTLSARAVAELLGLGCSKIVARWIRRGWLKARNAGSKTRPLWRIDRCDLDTFLENESVWMAWEPSLIRDSALREWATELRHGRPRWLPIGEVAQRYHVEWRAVGVWIRRGWLPGVRYGNWWLRESDLIGWVVPGDRPHTDAPMDWPSDGWHTILQIEGLTLRRRKAA